MTKPTGQDKATFRAKCKLGRWAPFDQLPLNNQGHQTTTQHRWNRELQADEYVVDCNQEFTDRAEFEAHMRELHDDHGYRWDSPWSSDPNRTIRNYKRREGKGYTKPRLTEDGRPFEPTGTDPGATVTWRELVETGETYHDEELGRDVARKDWVERSGQVWSAAPYPKSVWVVPFELLPGELCVLLREDRLGSDLRHSVTQYTKAHRTRGAA